MSLKINNTILDKNNTNPWLWVPSLNFASGLPYAIIVSVSVIMYKNLGVDNIDIGFYTSLLSIPWIIKPLWSPFIDLRSTKRKWFLRMQLIISLAFLIVGATIPLNHFFILSLAIFWIAALASASNDIATDGFYLLALSKDKQSLFLGIRSTFYRLAMLTGNGLIVIIGGHLETKYGDKQKAWSYTMLIVGLLMTVVTIYNYLATPDVENELAKDKSQNSNDFKTVFNSFFEKKQIGIVLMFILLFRLGESQLMKMLVPFLIDPKSKGGMELTTESVGIIYGTFGVIALLAGGTFGGIAISKKGLGKCMLPMMFIMHLPIIGFIILSYFQPENILFVYLTVIIEQFGYGFGFSAFMMYLIYVADGESKTSHYAIATGFMALGMMLPGMLSGYIQDFLGYGNFFIWVLFTTIPGLVVYKFLEFPSDFGKKTENL